MARPPRLAGFDYTGFYRYFLTICAYERETRFADAGVVEVVLAQIRYTSLEQDFEIPAYCFMPDHIHVLSAGRSRRAEFLRFAARVKQRSGFRFRRARQQRLWQEGFYDRVLRDEDVTPAVIAYIIGNPVRSRLVSAPLEYPFCGSETHTREELLEYVGGYDGFEWSV